MNIQIFGKKKCFDTQKAERYFKERRISYQYIDIIKYGLSKGELQSVLNTVAWDALVNTESEKFRSSTIPYLNSIDNKIEALLEQPTFYNTPIVRNGKKATVGYKPEVWSSWE